MSETVKISDFVAFLTARVAAKDGYIMGATGQNPKKWAKNSWWFTQYSGSQRTQALRWRKTARRVWDCNGLAEGFYKDQTGVDINTKARYNYANWCSVKGTGLIPAAHRCAGAAVFWGKKASTITHVAFLEKPVDAKNPGGDWYLIEARGVAFGVVRTRLSQRKPNFWGLMTKYYRYDDAPRVIVTQHSTLRKGSKGSEVKQLQKQLLKLGYKLPKYGADGDFGSETEKAVKAFQTDEGLQVDGIVGPKTWAALDAAIK